ncbi:unnamed protein product [Anisakis simplex]|uniref:DUF1272 domain-containing protein n=1 Tax=Anisakis simplex TaxID=6269 RepID=A0A0M3K9M4_ANISI|nr:unnamed protein product [Anisakis simplex]
MVNPICAHCDDLLTIGDDLDSGDNASARRVSINISLKTV